MRIVTLQDPSSVYICKLVPELSRMAGKFIQRCCRAYWNGPVHGPKREMNLDIAVVFVTLLMAVTVMILVQLLVQQILVLMFQP